VTITNRRIVILLTLLVLGGCAVVPENAGRIESRAYADTRDTALGKLSRERSGGHPGQSGFRLLGSGLDAFVARAVLAQRAERGIDAQYYLLHNDLTGRLFVDQLLKAADRGVRVRLLVDDMDLGGRDIGAATLDAHPNVEVRLFNPFARNVGRTSQFVTRLGSVTRRMHNKTFTVDNQATVLGGRNIGDEYFEADPSLAFADLDVLGIGPVARQVSSSFDAYWNHPLAYPVGTLVSQTPTPEQIAALRAELEAFVAKQHDSPYLDALRSSDLARQIRRHEIRFSWGEAKVVSDDPEKLAADRDQTQYRLAEDLRPYLAALQRELIIFSPYFVPGREGVELFEDLVARGVRVRILTNSLASTDVSIVHAGYSRHREDLLRVGVELYELNVKVDGDRRHSSGGMSGSSKASLHAKSFVLDRERVFIGSLNLDPRSLVENTEIGVVIDSPEIARTMADWFDENIGTVAFEVKLERDDEGVEFLRWYGQRGGQPQVFEYDPYTGLWQRFSVDFMQLFPVDSQL
jgi:putative cardiolipin synthase